MPKNKDSALLEALSSTLEGVAAAFGPNCEVVLHSLTDLSKSVIKIINGHVTGRSIGSPLTNLGIEVLEKANSLNGEIVGPYFTKLDDGRILRCVTTLIRNPAGKAIGMLCINIDLSVPVLDFCKDFLNVGTVVPETAVEHFPPTPKELISRVLGLVRENVNKQNRLSPSEKNKMIVMDLYRQGIFNVRGAVDMVASESGISRYTVYNYIREAKNQPKKD